MFFLSPENIAIPGDETADFDTLFEADDASETPSEEHGKFMRTGECSFLPPLCFCIAECEMVRASGNEAGDELFDDIGADINSQWREEEWSR
jgi:hypothetical protein